MIRNLSLISILILFSPTLAQKKKKQHFDATPVEQPDGMSAEEPQTPAAGENLPTTSSFDSYFLYPENITAKWFVAKMGNAEMKKEFLQVRCDDEIRIMTVTYIQDKVMNVNIKDMHSDQAGLRILREHNSRPRGGKYARRKYDKINYFLKWPISTANDPGLRAEWQKVNMTGGNSSMITNHVHLKQDGADGLTVRTPAIVMWETFKIGRVTYKETSVFGENLGITNFSVETDSGLMYNFALSEQNNNRSSEEICKPYRDK